VRQNPGGAGPQVGLWFGVQSGVRARRIQRREYFERTGRHLPASGGWLRAAWHLLGELWHPLSRVINFVVTAAGEFAKTAGKILAASHKLTAKLPWEIRLGLTCWAVYSVAAIATSPQAIANRIGSYIGQQSAAGANALGGALGTAASWWKIELSRWGRAAGPGLTLPVW